MKKNTKTARNDVPGNEEKSQKRIKLPLINNVEKQLLVEQMKTRESSTILLDSLFPCHLHWTTKTIKQAYKYLTENKKCDIEYNSFCSIFFSYEEFYLHEIITPKELFKNIVKKWINDRHKYIRLDRFFEKAGLYEDFYPEKALLQYQCYKFADILNEE